VFQYHYFSRQKANKIALYPHESKSAISEKVGNSFIGRNKANSILILIFYFF